MHRKPYNLGDAQEQTKIDVEIASVLAEAQLALYSAIKTPADATHICFYLTCLHEIHGMLRGPGIEAVVGLLEGMQHVAAILLSDEIDSKSAIYKSLMRAMVQFQDYLFGPKEQRKSSSTIDAAIEDLRKYCSKPLHPQEPRSIQQLTVKHQLPEDSSAIAKSLRPQYQQALLTWYRDPMRKDKLRELLAIADQIRGACLLEPVHQLWQVAGATIEALIEGGLEYNQSAKLLLGQLDRQIKKMVAEGEEALVSVPYDPLIENLLRHLEKAKTKGTRIEEVKSMFSAPTHYSGHSAGGGKGSSINAEKESLTSIVGAVIQDEVAKIIAQLEQDDGKDKLASDELVRMADRLRQIAGALVMMGYYLPRTNILRQVVVIDEAIKYERSLDANSRSRLLHVLSNVISLFESDVARVSTNRSGEASEAIHNRLRGKGLPVSESQAPSSIEAPDAGLGRHAVIHAVIDEVIVELALARRSIESALAGQDGPSLVSQLQGIMARVRGALYMISAQSSATLVSLCGELIQGPARHEQQSLTQQELQMLTQIIAVLESYLLNGAVMEMDSTPRAIQLQIDTLGRYLEDYQRDTQQSSVEPLATTRPLALDDAKDALDVYVDEARELTRRCHTILQQWGADPTNIALVQGLRRELHTLKGGARLAGMYGIADLSHGMEAVLSAVIEAQLPVTDSLLRVLTKVKDHLLLMVSEVKVGGADETVSELLHDMEAILGNVAELAAATPEPPAHRKLPHSTQGQGENRHVCEPINVREDDYASFIDKIAKRASEVEVMQSQLAQQMAVLQGRLEELPQVLSKLEGYTSMEAASGRAPALHDLDRRGSHAGNYLPYANVVPLSFSKDITAAFGEEIGSIKAVVSQSRVIVNHTRELLHRQFLVNADVKESIAMARMASLSDYEERLRRVSDQVCHDLGKHAQLRIIGGQCEIDNRVLNKMLAPLEHLLRNAIAHGIEHPNIRRKLAKPEQGSVLLQLTVEGSRAIFTVSDDGAGLDLDAIRRKATARGLVDEKAAVSDRQAMRFVIEPGFSTVERVDQIAGRGVGLDVVNSIATQLGGNLDIDSCTGRGAVFTVRVPLSLHVDQVLVSYAGNQSCAIPVQNLEGVAWIRGRELEKIYARQSPCYHYGGEAYQLRSLPSVLGILPAAALNEEREYPLVLVRSGDSRFALAVDGLGGCQEFINRYQGAARRYTSEVSSAIVLGDGQISQVLDVTKLHDLGASKFIAKDFVLPSKTVLENTLEEFFNEGDGPAELAERALRQEIHPIDVGRGAEKI